MKCYTKAVTDLLGYQRTCEILDYIKLAERYLRK